MASFDCTREGPRQREYPDLLQRDLDRYSLADLPATDIFCFLSATHLLDSPEAKISGVIKYAAGFRSAFARLQTEALIRETAEHNLRACLTAEAAAKGVVRGGRAFGVRVELLWWLYGPFRTPGNLQICARQRIVDGGTASLNFHGREFS